MLLRYQRNFRCPSYNSFMRKLVACVAHCSLQEHAVLLCIAACIVAARLPAPFQLQQPAVFWHRIIPAASVLASAIMLLEVMFAVLRLWCLRSNHSLFVKPACLLGGQASGPVYTRCQMLHSANDKLASSEMVALSRCSSFGCSSGLHVFATCIVLSCSILWCVCARLRWPIEKCTSKDAV